jgi:ATP-binding cassette subfamily C (CFTR/MRP) protein 4
VSPSFLGLLLSQLIQLTGSLQWTVRQSSELENQMVSTERVFEYSSILPEKGYADGISVPLDWPMSGRLSIQEMSLVYPNLANPSKTNEPVLKNISINFEPGKKFALVGRTGAGI